MDQKLYLKAQDASNIYGIQTKIVSTKQDNLTVTEYFSSTTNFWQEMDLYRRSGDTQALLQGKRERLNF